VDLANRKWPIGKEEEQEKSTGQNNGALLYFLAFHSSML
jgi:hypothetical protein